MNYTTSVAVSAALGLLLTNARAEEQDESAKLLSQLAAINKVLDQPPEVSPLQPAKPAPSSGLHGRRESGLKSE